MAMIARLILLASLAAVLIPGSGYGTRGPEKAAAAGPGPSDPFTGTAPSRPSEEPAVLGTIVAARSVARYRVREQLVGFQFPNDAIGETKEISGMVALTSDGTVIAEQSRFVVDLRSLTSDEFRRDRYIRTNTLATDQFPNVVFVLRSVRGLSWPPPTGGDASFQLIGDLTVRDRTRTVIWDTTARFGPLEVTGRARTSFTFAEFGLTKPRVFSVLSVEDTIRLELDFVLSRSR